MINPCQTSDLLSLRTAKFASSILVSDVLLRVSPDVFHDIRRAFYSESEETQISSGLSLQEFIFVLSTRLSSYIPEHLVGTPLERALTNLFGLMHANGVVTFELFSNFVVNCLDSGFFNGGKSVLAHLIVPSNYLTFPSTSELFSTHNQPLSLHYVLRNMLVFLTRTAAHVFTTSMTKCFTLNIPSPSYAQGIPSRTQLIVSGSWKIYLYDTTTLAKLSEFDLPSSINCFKYIPYLDSVCVGLSDGRIALVLLASIDVLGTSLPLLSTNHHTGWVTGISTLHSRQAVVSCSDDGSLVLWDLHEIDSNSFVNLGAASSGLRLFPRLVFHTNQRPISTLDTCDELNLIVTGDRSGCISLFSPYVDKVSASLSLDRPILKLVISPSRTSIIALDQSYKLKIIDLKVLRVVQSLGDTSSPIFQHPIIYFECFLPTRHEKVKESQAERSSSEMSMIGRTTSSLSIAPIKGGQLRHSDSLRSLANSTNMSSSSGLGQLFVISRNHQLTSFDEDPCASSTMITGNAISHETPSCPIATISFVENNVFCSVFGASIFIYSMSDGRYKTSIGGSIEVLFNFHKKNGSIIHQHVPQISRNSPTPLGLSGVGGGSSTPIHSCFAGKSSIVNGIPEISYATRGHCGHNLLLGTTDGTVFAFSSSNWSPLICYKIADRSIKFLSSFVGVNRGDNDILQSILIVSTQSMVYSFDISKIENPFNVSSFSLASTPNSFALASLSPRIATLAVGFSYSLRLFEPKMGTVLARISISVNRIHFCNQLSCFLILSFEPRIYIVCGFSLRVLHVINLEGITDFQDYDDVFLTTCIKRGITRGLEYLTGIFLCVSVGFKLFSFDITSPLLHLLCSYWEKLEPTSSSSSYSFSQSSIDHKYSKPPTLALKDANSFSITECSISPSSTATFHLSITALNTTSEASPAVFVVLSDGHVIVVDVVNGSILAETQRPKETLIDNFDWSISSALFKTTNGDNLAIRDDVADGNDDVVNYDPLMSSLKQLQQSLLAFSNVSDSSFSFSEPVSVLEHSKSVSSLYSSPPAVKLFTPKDNSQDFVTPKIKQNKGKDKDAVNTGFLIGLSPYFSSVSRLNTDGTQTVQPFYLNRSKSSMDDRSVLKAPPALPKIKKSRTKFGDLQLLETIAGFEVLEDKESNKKISTNSNRTRSSREVAIVHFGSSKDNEKTQNEVQKAVERVLKVSQQHGSSPINLTSKRKNLYSLKKPKKANSVPLSSFTKADVTEYQEITPFTRLFNVKEEFLAHNEPKRLS
ncbi:hypothetical protein RCL1_002489 [Eukaryota sp. TZLM3-RCL]